MRPFDAPAAPLQFVFAVQGFGLRVSGVGFRGLSFRVSGVEFRGLGFRVQGSEFRVWVWGFGVWGLRFRVQGLGSRVKGPEVEDEGLPFGV